MPVILLRGKDEYRRQQFWGKLKSEGYSRELYKGDVSGLQDRLQTPHLFGKVAYYIEDQKLIVAVTDFLLHNSLEHLLVVDQRDRSDACYRRMSRRFEIVTCDPIWAYKQEEVIQWIFDVAAEMGLSITYLDARVLLDNLGEESLEIVRVLELHKLSGFEISQLVEYDTSKAMLVVIDSVARHKYDQAIKALIFLQQQGVEFMQVASALLTRYELFLRIKCSRMLRISDEDIKIQMRLSRMIAGNVLSEANMNTFEFIIKFMKNLVVNSLSPVGYDWLVLTLMSL